MNYSNILFSKEDRVAIIRMNRPKAFNAINNETMYELKDCFEQIEKNDEIRVVILTGEGNKSFVAGADISYMKTMNVFEGESWSNLGQDIMNSIVNSSKIFIAAINGYALGGGCELALACDIRIASTNAKFGQPEVNLGIIPGFGGTQRLPKQVGKSMAKLLMLTGDMINANDALSRGLVDKVVPDEKLLSTTLEFAKNIANKPANCVSYIKLLVNISNEVSEGIGENLEAKCFGKCFSSQNQIEGMDAFLNKRKPCFK
jgi:enoyl-CoA hydratase